MGALNQVEYFIMVRIPLRFTLYVPSFVFANFGFLPSLLREDSIINLD